MTDLADIKARLEAHCAHFEKYGWSPEMPREAWARDVDTLLTALDERDKAIRKHCLSCPDYGACKGGCPLYPFREA